MGIRVRETNDLDGLSRYGQENIHKLGSVVVENWKRTGKYNKFMENLSTKYNVKREDLTIAESDVYTTAISNFIERRLRPKLVAAGLVKSITLPTRGFGAIKIPLRNALVTATDLPDSGAVTYDTGSYDSTTITPRYIYAAQSITHEVAKVANVDLLAEELGEIGDALSRKMDSDIISEFQTATTTANGNRTPLGASTTITFDTLVNGQASAIANYAEPDALLVSPSTAATIMKLDEFSGGNGIAGALNYQGGNGTTFPYVQGVLGMKLIVSNQVDDDDIYLIDTARNGYLVQANGIETFDGRRTGYLAYEVIGALMFDVGIVQPKSIYRIEENSN